MFGPKNPAVGAGDQSAAAEAAAGFTDYRSSGRCCKATPTGSSWDTATGPEQINPRHLAEWVKGSAVRPELAAANLQTLKGSAVLEALAGDRLEALGGHGQQYVTGEVARRLEPLEPIAEAGGWWCEGLDPLADWRPMGWGTFRPDAPRFDQERGRHRKYEHPLGVPTRTFWLRVPAVVAALVADRAGLELPLEVGSDGDGSRGAYWRWWATEPRLPLLVIEGAKKAAAALSIGVPAVALPGIWNGAPKNAAGQPELHPDLAGVPLKGREVWVLFDHSKKKDPAEPKAADRLGWKLRAAGADVRVGIMPGTKGKGLDDHLLAGGTWDEVAEVLKSITNRPVLPWLRRADVTVPHGQYLGQGVSIPPAERARLVAICGAMGCGKTRLIVKYIKSLGDVPVLIISHSRALAAQLAKDLGVAWAQDEPPGSVVRMLGVAVCFDSFCPNSGQRIHPRDWKDCVVVIDEVCAGLSHMLMGDGTAIADRRVEVTDTLLEVLKPGGARQVIICDAQLSNPILKAIEDATQETAHLIVSEHKPAAGRIAYKTDDQGRWRLHLVKAAQSRQRFWAAVTAQQARMPNAAQSIARLVRKYWPEARVLVVDSHTIADPDHDAYKLATDPDTIVVKYDVVVATTAVAYGLSVTVKGHFDAVFVHTGGGVSVETTAQSAARVRDDCPRYICVPNSSRIRPNRVGSGNTDPKTVIRHADRHTQAIICQLLAGGGYAPEVNNAGPWVPLWAELAATRNRQGFAYGATVIGLLEREGYKAVPMESTGNGPEDTEYEDAAEVAKKLKDITTDGDNRELSAVIKSTLPTAAEAASLAKKQRLTSEERASLTHYKTLKAWALKQFPEPDPAIGERLDELELQGKEESEEYKKLMKEWIKPKEQSLELVKARRDGLHYRLRFGWLLLNPQGDHAANLADQHAARLIGRTGRAWGPDLCRRNIGQRLAVARALGLDRWITREHPFREDDPELLKLHERMHAMRGDVMQVLGISPDAAKPSTTLRRLLAIAGYRFKKKPRRRQIDGHRATYHQIERIPLPEPVSWESLTEAWAAEAFGINAIQKVARKSQLEIGMGDSCHSAPPAAVGIGTPVETRIGAEWVPVGHVLDLDEAEGLAVVGSGSNPVRQLLRLQELRPRPPAAPASSQRHPDPLIGAEL